MQEVKTTQEVSIEELSAEEIIAVSGGGTSRGVLDGIQDAIDQGWYSNGLQCVVIR